MQSPDGQHVVKSNALIEASYRLNLREQRIILACIAQVDRSQPITDEVQYVITTRRFAEMADCRIDGAYYEMKLAAESLFERRLTVHEHPNTGVPRKLTMRWIQSIEYKEGEGAIALRFGKDILPYLTELTRRFTQYALSDVASMNSPHAIRLYELLMQWRDTGKRVVSLDWMRQCLGIEGKYPAFKDLRRYLIEPSVKQINDHAPITVKWEPQKTGRKVTHLAFSFTVDKPKAVAAPKKQPEGGNKPSSNEKTIKGVPISMIEARANPGESYEACAVRLIGERERAKRLKTG